MNITPCFAHKLTGQCAADEIEKPPCVQVALNHHQGHSVDRWAPLARFATSKINGGRLQTVLTLTLLGLSALLLPCPARASDWPHLLGPTRDAVYTGPALAEKWLAGPPPWMN